MRATTRSVFLIAAAVLMLGACAIYRPEIRQGNFVDDRKTAQVVAGMTREQVQFLLGPPMITDPFHSDRWDYVFTLSSPLTNDERIGRRFIVLFDGEKVREVKTVD